MQMIDYAVEIAFTEPVLGTTPVDLATWDTFVRRRTTWVVRDGQRVAVPFVPESGTADEVRMHPSYVDGPTMARAARADRKRAEDADPTVVGDHEVERTTTFFRDAQGAPVLLNYQVLGHLKEGANILKDGLGVKNLRAKVERYVYVMPRVIPIQGPVVMGEVTRPLRAETMQGPRVTIVSSDAVMAGATAAFTLRVVPGPVTEETLRALLDFGALRGIGQWRGGSWGTYAVQRFERIDA